MLEHQLETRPLTLGLIGAGLWGKELLRAASDRRLVCVKVKTVCDIAATEQPKVAAAWPEVTFVDDYRRVLDDPAIEAVAVATPTHRHTPLVLAALAAGKHVWCAAPLANSIEDVAAMIRAAVAARRVFEPGLYRRRFPLYSVLRGAFRGGAPAGPIVSVRSQWRQRVNWRRPGATPERGRERSWRCYAESSLGPVLELGIHQIDTLCYWSGRRPTQVSGEGRTTTWATEGWEVPDTTYLRLDLPGVPSTEVESTTATSAGGHREELCAAGGSVLYLDRGERSEQYLFSEPGVASVGWEAFARKREILGEVGIVMHGSADPLPYPNDFTIERTAAGLVLWQPSLWYSLFALARRVRDEQAESLKPAYRSHVAAIRAAQAVREGRPVTISEADYTLT